MTLPVLNAILSTVLGIFVSVLTALITHKLKQFDENAAKYRKEREAKEQKEAEERKLREEANDQLTLGMARTMLLNNYEYCVNKGYYSVAEREVFHKLYEAYRRDNGNGVIEDIAEKIVQLPTEDPNKKNK